MSKNVPPEFIPVSASLINRLSHLVRLCLDDASCLCAWIDGEEYAVRNYISEKAFKVFNGFSSSLVKSLVDVNEICKSLDLTLDL